MFLARLLTMAKMQKQLKSPSIGEWTNKLGDTHTWNIVQLQKEQSSDTCCHVDEP